MRRARVPRDVTIRIEQRTRGKRWPDANTAVDRVLTFKEAPKVLRHRARVFQKTSVQGFDEGQISGAEHR